MPRYPHRRDLLTAAASLSLSSLLNPASRAAAQRPIAQLGPLSPFSYDRVVDLARELSRAPWRPAASPHADVLDRIGYDAYQKIRFKSQASIELGASRHNPVQLFHLGQLFKEPVRVHVVKGASAREILYTPALFDTPADHPARDLPEATGFAGFRVMDDNLKTDWLSFLGASYFRTSGPYNQYGLSARGLAIDSGLPIPEEFPRFTQFWLEEAPGTASHLTVTALLDSARVTGSFQFAIARQTDKLGIHKCIMSVEAVLFARARMTRLGVAPFSSMFWYGEANRTQAVDWRPEIHDSDGLAILTGSGERIWRPLNNPPHVMTNTFIDRDPKGFGLLQRDRNFVHYLDDGVFYERRPSVWVEPLDPWGEGAVHLVEIPTQDETNDNIVAYWCPKEPFEAGQERRYRYRLTWLDDIALEEHLARATATWTGLGGHPGATRPKGVRKFVIDFQGPVLAPLGRNDGIEIVVTASRGAITNAYCHPVVGQQARWRAFFDLTAAAGTAPVDLRAYLRKGETALTETWLYQYFPGA